MSHYQEFDNKSVELVTSKVLPRDILQKAIELQELKGKDYNGNVTIDDYFPFGEKSYAHMVHTKYLRMMSVLEQESTNFESLEDTLLDMINYCSFFAAYLENKK